MFMALQMEDHYPITGYLRKDAGNSEYAANGRSSSAITTS